MINARLLSMVPAAGVLPHLMGAAQSAEAGGDANLEITITGKLGPILAGTDPLGANGQKFTLYGSWT